MGGIPEPVVHKAEAWIKAHPENTDHDAINEEGFFHLLNWMIHQDGVQC